MNYLTLYGILTTGAHRGGGKRPPERQKRVSMLRFIRTNYNTDMWDMINAAEIRQGKWKIALIKVVGRR